MSREWYYSMAGEQAGPVNEESLQALIQQGIVQQNTFLWSDGMGDWSEASLVLPHLFPAPTVNIPNVSVPVVTSPVVKTLNANPATSSSGLTTNSPFAVSGTEPYRASTASQLVTRDEGYSMTPMQVLFSFNGRIRRSVFWGYTVAITAVFFGVVYGAMAIFGEDSPWMGIPAILVFILFIWTSLAIRVKRWHDRGKSGGWVLISLIPYVGDIWAFIENGCLDGDFGRNAYGPDPKSRGRN